MNDILLISKLSPQDYSNEKRKVFFVLGGMNIAKVENKVVDLLLQEGKMDYKDIVLKYNGVELNVKTQDIPNVVKLLSKENISIYSIFQIYDPD
ncbi:MAG: hypothetical protein GX021_07930 [Tissierellia bacterium]|nr:hypothetical protein [Tissierellia bacterium]